jgi:hypothetical protein
MAENFFAKFHDVPPDAAPAGTASPNYFSQFHDDAAPPPVTEKNGRLYVAPEGAPVVKRPDAGGSDAAKRGLMQGMTANWDDELQAIAKAGGATEERNGIDHLLIGLARLATGNEEARKTYDEEVTKNREANKAASENHPYIHGGAEAAGMLLTLPVGGEASGGTTLLSRALAAGKQGAIYGGVSGAGEGEGAADKLSKGTAGTVLGGVAGFAGQPIVEGAGTVLKKGTEGLRNAVRGAINPEGEAARRYLTALEHDIQADPRALSRMTPVEFNAHPDARLMDLGGGLVKRLADSANITSPAGGLKMKQAIDQRFEGQTNRFSDWFRSHFNYPDAYAQQQALDQVAKNVNRPAYLKAYSEGDRSLMSPEMERLMSSPKVVEAMKAASKSGKDRAVTEGYGAFNPGVTIENDVVKFHPGKDGAPTFPNLQYWDQVRRELSQAAKKAGRAGADEDASVYGDLAKRMNTELDKLVPSYKAARQGAAGFFGAENALEAGQKFVMSDAVSLPEARNMIAKMTPAERKLFTDGFVSDYLDKVINTTGDRRDVLNKIADNPKAREKLELVMGPQKYRELEAKIRVEGIFDDVRKAVQGNSWTAKRLYDLGLAGGAVEGAHGAYDMDPKELATGALISALASGGKKVNVNVATKVAEMMLSRDPSVVKQGFKYVSGNSAFMDALRAADTKIGRLLSEAAPTNATLQMIGVSRADDQPNVKGPPNK